MKSKLAAVSFLLLLCAITASATPDSFCGPDQLEGAINRSLRVMWILRHVPQPWTVILRVVLLSFKFKLWLVITCCCRVLIDTSDRLVDVENFARLSHRWLGGNSYFWGAPVLYVKVDGLGYWGLCGEQWHAPLPSVLLDGVGRWMLQGQPVHLYAAYRCMNSSASMLKKPPSIIHFSSVYNEQAPSCAASSVPPQSCPLPCESWSPPQVCSGLAMPPCAG